MPPRSKDLSVNSRLDTIIAGQSRQEVAFTQHEREEWGMFEDIRTHMRHTDDRLREMRDDIESMRYNISSHRMRIRRLTFALVIIGLFIFGIFLIIPTPWI